MNIVEVRRRLEALARDIPNETTDRGLMRAKMMLLCLAGALCVDEHAEQLVGILGDFSKRSIAGIQKGLA